MARPDQIPPAVPPVQLSLRELADTLELNQLPDEAARYLSAVDLFRAEGCPPTWRAESDEISALSAVDHTIVRDQS